MSSASEKIIVIGAGMGGLASAIRLAHGGYAVHVVEKASGPGGKMRTLPSVAGPVDAGPTVLTMRHQFDALFELAGERLEDHVALQREHILARHWWRDGTSLDLTDDHDANVAAIEAMSGVTDAAAFHQFTRRARMLFEAFEAPMMETGEPSLTRLAMAALTRPTLWPTLLPVLTMAHALRTTFADPRLRQLFGRYATYVGGTPSKTPALLQLIWHAEASGVWCVQGGLHELAKALEKLAACLGVTFEYEAKVERIEKQAGHVTAVHVAGGRRLIADAIVFNGDPNALATGHLGPAVLEATPKRAVSPRSLSARVWAFAATPKGLDLAHHNVLFGCDPRDEFEPIARGHAPIEPTLYVCAQDRGTNTTPPEIERFEIIENAAPSDAIETTEKETCRTRVFPQLAEFGLSFAPTPDLKTLTVPGEFHGLFPGSFGSLYGRSPHGMTAALNRPTARTAVKGLYLAGGGAHPGAGIAMATLSGKHAAAAIRADLASRSMSPKTATHGGTSTASPTAELKPSRSLPS